MRDGWREVTLGDVVGASRDRYRPCDYDEAAEVILYSIPALDSHGGPEVTTAGGILSDKFAISTDAVLVSMLNPRIPRRIRAYGGENVACSTEFAVLRSDSVALTLEYLSVITRQAAFFEFLDRRAKGSTGSRKRAKIADALAFSIALPPLDEQRRIVDLIAAVDDAVDAAEAEAEAEQRTLTDIGLVANERVASGEWSTVTLAQALGTGSIMTGPFGSALHQEDYREVGTPVVMPKNIIGQRVDYDGIARIGDEDVERLTRYQTRAGDILWSRRGDVTRFAVIGDADAGSLCGTGCFIVRPEDAKVTPWLEMWMATPLVKQWLTERAVGATMANLNTSLLGGAPVADVPEEKRGVLVASISSLRDAADAAHATADALRALRSNLLTVLLSGEHEIPASYDALLEEVA